jgi:hypothetical protein
MFRRKNLDSILATFNKVHDELRAYCDEAQIRKENANKEYAQANNDLAKASEAIQYIKPLVTNGN